MVHPYRVASPTSGSPLLLFFSVSLILVLVALGCLLTLLGLMRNSERPGFPIFVALGQREVVTTVA